MKEIAKTLGRTLALAAGALLFSVSTQAQLTSPVVYQAPALSQTNSALGSLDGSNTNAIVTATGATNLMINIPNAANFGEVGIQWNFKLMGAGSTACLAVFDASADGSFWIPSYTVLSVTPSATTVVGGYTNITLNSIGYLRLSYITNATANIMTNISLKAVYKPKRYGT